MLETGIRGKQSVAVTPENTAKTMGSGTLNVFATPALVALAEKTCWMSVADALDEGCGPVGTKLELEHTALVYLNKCLLHLDPAPHYDFCL